MYANAKSKELDIEIKAVRKTPTGDMLVELGFNTKDGASFLNALKTILGERANITTLEPNDMLKLSDIDCLTVREEV